MATGLKLRAQDADDLKVVSAMMQDAIIPICDVGYLPDEQAFVLVANRFKWECAERNGAKAATGPTPDEDCGFERTNCAIRFHNITRASYRNLDLRDRTQMLSLLSIEPGEGAVLLHFSGGHCVRLETAALDVRLEDIGEPWPTGARPCHDGQAATA
ncbi:DUF2948 family protein [Aerophototrophica crusticola]|uniref:DUF2948 family protein n=1 Tax=Aerophototrophica crusticola TaxID=1709002 RepID=A0A858R8Q7_9PROT|nr:DUF2948 family protein [Rhodospirillaceae bacterium B3]